ncbi:MAG: hypothetical protein IH945_06795, partial [Armatimonadetes bacterium]|nr:hypothetical protein [Armatimonadota bacterium]
ASLGMYDEETPAGWKDDVDRGSSLAADPVANERLELICGPVLRQLSDAENVSVIALLTDWMWSGPDWLEPNGEADPTVGVALMSMIDGTWLDYSKDWKRNGYWLLTPRNLQEHEQRRYDRKAHRDAISLVSRSRWFDMQFWWFVFSRMKNSDQINALRHDMRGHFEMPSGYAPVEALSLLSSFTASDVALAKSGQLLRPLASLPPKIRSKLTESAVSGTLTSQPRQHDEFGYPIYSRTESDRDEIVDGLIAFRDGIPSRAIARIELQREVRFHPKIKDEENMGEMELSMRAFSRMSPLQIAQYLVTIEEESERAQQWKDSWDFDKVYVSYNDVIRITVDWPGCGFSELHFSIPIEPAFFDRGPLNSLPADARALLNLAIAKEKADIERRRKAAKDGGTK